MERYLLVMLGGAIGAGLRYGIGGAFQQLFGPGFPWGTVFVNVTGSFFVGVVLGLALGGALSPEARLFLAVGVMGGYTTFSSFSYEALVLARDGAWRAALVYVLGTGLGGLFAAFVGLRLAERLGA